MTKSSYACGHPDVPSNTHMNGKYRRCGTCQRARVAAIRERQRQDERRLMREELTELQREVAELRNEVEDIKAAA